MDEISAQQKISDEKPDQRRSSRSHREPRRFEPDRGVCDKDWSEVPDDWASASFVQVVVEGAPFFLDPRHREQARSILGLSQVNMVPGSFVTFEDVRLKSEGTLFENGMPLKLKQTVQSVCDQLGLELRDKRISVLPNGRLADALYAHQKSPDVGLVVDSSGVSDALQRVRFRASVYVTAKDGTYARTTYDGTTRAGAELTTRLLGPREGESYARVVLQLNLTKAPLKVAKLLAGAGFTEDTFFWTRESGESSEDDQPKKRRRTHSDVEERVRDALADIDGYALEAEGLSDCFVNKHTNERVAWTFWLIQTAAAATQLKDKEALDVLAKSIRVSLAAQLKGERRTISTDGLGVDLATARPEVRDDGRLVVPCTLHIFTPLTMTVTLDCTATVAGTTHSLFQANFRTALHSLTPPQDEYAMFRELVGTRLLKPNALAAVMNRRGDLADGVGRVSVGAGCELYAASAVVEQAAGGGGSRRADTARMRGDIVAMCAFAGVFSGRLVFDNNLDLYAAASIRRCPSLVTAGLLSCRSAHFLEHDEEYPHLARAFAQVSQDTPRGDANRLVEQAHAVGLMLFLVVIQAARLNNFPFTRVLKAHRFDAVNGFFSPELVLRILRGPLEPLSSGDFQLRAAQEALEGFRRLSRGVDEQHVRDALAALRDDGLLDADVDAAFLILRSFAVLLFGERYAEVLQNKLLPELLPVYSPRDLAERCAFRKDASSLTTTTMLDSNFKGGMMQVFCMLHTPHYYKKLAAIGASQPTGSLLHTLLLYATGTVCLPPSGNVAIIFKLEDPPPPPPGLQDKVDWHFMPLKAVTCDEATITIYRGFEDLEDVAAVFYTLLRDFDGTTVGLT